MHTKQLEYTRKLRFKLVKGARKDREGRYGEDDAFLSFVAKHRGATGMAHFF